MGRTQQEIDEDKEQDAHEVAECRHLESMAATMAAAFIAKGQIPDMTDAVDCVKLARRIRKASREVDYGQHG